MGKSKRKGANNNGNGAQVSTAKPVSPLIAAVLGLDRSVPRANLREGEMDFRHRNPRASVYAMESLHIAGVGA